MKIKVKSETDLGAPYFSPYDSKDIALFHFVTLGSISVKVNYWYDYAVPVIVALGWEWEIVK